MQGDLPFGDRNVFNYPESKVQLGKPYKRACAFLLLQLFFFFFKKHVKIFKSTDVDSILKSALYSLRASRGTGVDCMSEQKVPCMHRGYKVPSYTVEVVSQVLETRKSRGRQTPDRLSQPLYHDS